MYPGTDLIEIERVVLALKRHPQLKERLFTEQEIWQCEEKGFPAASLAGRFAAKEAVLKAFGTGLRGLKWLDIEIVCDSMGKPEVFLHGEAAALACKLGISKVKVSISHSREMALAFAVALTGRD